MKTYEETAQYILEVRNKHDKKVKRRKALAMRIIPITAGICGTVVICLAAVKNNRKPIDLITGESIITGGSISIVTTASHGTEEAVTTLISAEKTTDQTTTKTTVSATSLTTIEKPAIVEQTYAKAFNAVTSATNSAVRTTAAPEVTMATTVDAVTTAVTTQDITADPIIAGGGNDWNQWGQESNNWNNWSQGSNNWNQGSDSGEGSGFGGYGGGFSGGDSGVKAGSENSSDEQWNLLPINEKYCYAYIHGYDRIYTSLYPITSDYAGEWIDSAEMLGSQMIEGQEMKCVADVYSVKGITDASAVAIKFEGNDSYYLYYKPNADLYNIMNTVPRAG